MGDRKMLGSIVTSLVFAVAPCQTPPPPYVPGDTTVAILPLDNENPDTWEKLKARQSKAGFDEVTREFSSRGFRVLQPNAVEAAVTLLKLDMSDEENHTRKTLYRIGEQLDADLIFFGAVVHAYQQDSCSVTPKPAAEGPDGFTEVKVWLLDVKAHRIWLTAKPVQARSRSNWIDLLGKGSDREVAATADAIRIALTPFFAPYPLPTPKSAH